MSTTIATWTVTDLETMVTTLSEVLETAKSLGHHPSTVYPTMRQLTLMEETLSDGSTVLNLEFHAGDSDLRSMLALSSLSDLPVRVRGAAG